MFLLYGYVEDVAYRTNKPKMQAGLYKKAITSI